MKRIVLCFDGTWCLPADKDVPDADQIESNASRFYDSVPSVGADGVAQSVWYNPGVGTFFLNRLAGGAFGAGLDQHILDGYRRLVQVYEDGDEVYVLGFSRGAYTARSLVGLIRNCGLVHPTFSGFSVYVAYGIYRTRGDGPDSAAATAFRSMFAREIPIHFIGVWDTVGALGIPLPALTRLNAALYEFHDTELSGIVKFAYQAIALDEQRREFDITLWDPKQKPGQTLEQRWFIGSHSDVGGGEPDRRLSDITLRWMQDRAEDSGLTVSKVKLGQDNEKGALTDSYAEFLGGIVSVLEPRHLRTVFSTGFGNEVVDPTIDERRGDPDLNYDPKNPGLPSLTA